MSKTPAYGKVFAAHTDAAEMAQYARIAWVEAYTDLDARGLVTKPRLNMLDRYVRARTEYEFLYPIAMHEGPTLQSDSGGQYANMRYHAVAKLNEQIMKFEESLTISPRSVGIKGEAPKPDGEMPLPAKKYLERSKAH